MSKEHKDDFEFYNILLAPSSELFNQALVVMMSAILNCKYPCHFYIMQTDWSNNQKKEANEFISIYPGNQIIFIQINDNTFKDLTPWKGRYGTYYKILAHQYLPNSVERILYLDCDTYIAKDIYQYYSMDFKNNFIIGSTETLSLNIYNSMIKDGLEKHGIINCGVVLFNIEKFRKDNITINTYKNAIKKINGEYFMDQGLLSFIFKNCMIELPSYKYNHLMFQEGTENQMFTYKKVFSTSVKDRKNLFVKPYWNEVYDEEQDATIVHFAGFNVLKPWQASVKIHDGEVKISDIHFIERTHLTHDVVDKFYICWWKIAKMIPAYNFEHLLNESRNFENSILQKKLNDQLNLTDRALNFCVEICCDNFSEKRFERFVMNFTGKNIAVLKIQDRAAKVVIKAAEKFQVNIVFSSNKATLFQLSDNEFNKCKTADVIITCCIHGTKTHERNGVKCIDIYDLIHDDLLTTNLPIPAESRFCEMEKGLKRLSDELVEQSKSLSMVYAACTDSATEKMLRDEINILHTDKEQLREELGRSIAEQNMLNEHIRRINAEKDSLNNAVLKLTQEKSLLDIRLHEAESSLDSLESAKKSSADELARISKMLEDEQNTNSAAMLKINELTAQNGELAESKARLESETAALNGEINKLIVQKTDLAKAKVKLEDEKIALNLKIGTLTDQNNDLFNAKAELEHRSEELNALIDNLNSQKAELTNVADNLTAETETLNKKVDELNDTNSRLSAECIQAMQLYDDEKKANLATAQKIDKLTSEKDSMSKRIRELEIMLKEEQSKAAELDNQIENMKNSRSWKITKPIRNMSDRLKRKDN